MSYRRICFTHNNYGATDVNRYLAFVPEVCKYILIGKEVAPNTGTPHLQGFAKLVKKTRWQAILDLFPGCHIEVARGSYTFRVYLFENPP